MIIFKNHKSVQYNLQDSLRKFMTEVFERQSTIDQWDHDYYHPIALSFYDSAIRDMLNLMEVKVGDRVLDAGCGPGVHSIRVAEAGFNVSAIDISSQMLDEARKRAENKGVIDKINFAKQDLTKLDFPNNSFDYVFSWGVIIPIENVEKALDELVRIMKLGGKLALYITNKNSIDHKIEQKEKRNE